MERYTVEETAEKLGLQPTQTRRLIKKMLILGKSWDYEPMKESGNLVIMVTEEGVERLKVRPKRGRVPQSELR